MSVFQRSHRYRDWPHCQHFPKPPHGNPCTPPLRLLPFINITPFLLMFGHFQTFTSPTFILDAFRMVEDGHSPLLLPNTCTYTCFFLTSRHFKLISTNLRHSLPWPCPGPGHHAELFHLGNLRPWYPTLPVLQPFQHPLPLFYEENEISSCSAFPFSESTCPRLLPSLPLSQRLSDPSSSLLYLVYHGQFQCLSTLKSLTARPLTVTTVYTPKPESSSQSTTAPRRD